MYEHSLGVRIGLGLVLPMVLRLSNRVNCFSVIRVLTYPILLLQQSNLIFRLMGNNVLYLPVLERRVLYHILFYSASYFNETGEC